jgi:hypothetical protein
MKEAGFTTSLFHFNPDYVLGSEMRDKNARKSSI